MPKIVARREHVEQSPADVALDDLKVFETLKDRIKELTTLADVHKRRLMEFAETNGEEDDQGHFWVELPDGRKLKRERRVSTTLDEEAAIPLLKVKAPACVVTVEAVDDDEVMAARYRGELDDADLAAMYVQRETFAFIPPKKAAP